MVDASFRVGHGLDPSLDWIGWDDCDGVLISNYCCSVDVVSYKL